MIYRNIAIFQFVNTAIKIKEAIQACQIASFSGGKLLLTHIFQCH